MLHKDLLRLFPKLESDGAIPTSPRDPQYNCIAWSAKRDKKHWWQPYKEEPWDYWPPGMPEDAFKLQTFVTLFESLGYKKCDDSTFEFFYKKVALYATPAFGFSHVCDQLYNRRWSSKLSDLEDIEHNSLSCLEGSLTGEFGEVKQILKKRCGIIEIVKRVLFQFRLLFGRAAL